MVQIIADTLSSIPVSTAKELGIPFLPQIVIFGNDSYRDDSEMDSSMFLQKLRSSNQLPKTAAPPPDLYHPYYEQLKRNNNSAIVIAPSAGLSGTVRSAEVAALDYPDVDIRVLDTKTIAGGLGELVLIADKFAKDGMNIDTLFQKMTDLSSRSRTYFLVDTLEYLYKGGRIGGASALFGSILQVKPILTLVDGKTEPAEKQRTKKKALERIVELVAEECPRSADAHLCISQEGAPQDEIDYLVDNFKKNQGVSEIHIYSLPPAILTHAGPGAIAVSYIRK
ncbi:fatty acid-binding protein DegV [Leptolinea sp. HRD-7]|nr:fatty acid-binding protein DegV [Leptolinea sp. HRD-7]